MDIYYVMLEAVPRPDNPESRKFGGAYLNCWTKASTPEEALENAKSYLEAEGWNYINTQTLQNVQCDPPGEPDALTCYEQARRTGLGAMFYTWPIAEIAEGHFIHSRKALVRNILTLLCGLVLLGVFTFSRVLHSDAGFSTLLFLFLGIALSLIPIPPLLFNRGAFFRMEGNQITAKYHWCSKLDCTTDEIAFVLPQINTISLLLKNGKRHIIMGISNPVELSSAIRRQIFRPETESPESLRQKLDELWSARRKSLWQLLAGCIVLFIIVFIAVFITERRDLSEFTKTDWIIFWSMVFAELPAFVILLYLANRSGKSLLLIEQMSYRLRSVIIHSAPLPTNQVTAVCTDDDFTERMVISGFPKAEGIYYQMQEVLENYELETTYTSRIYAGIHELPDMDSRFPLDITSCF